MKINRYQAFGAHLFGSVMVALCSAALVFWVWYPAPLAEATGVTDIFLLLLAVDVTMGPVITLIVFNPAKKELKRDLAIVSLLQISALIYGLHAVFVARPIYIVYNADRFDLVYANDMTEAKLAKVTRPEFKSVPLFGPEVVAAHKPTDSKTRSDIMFSAIAGGDDLPQIPEHYVNYSEEKADVMKHLQPIDKLRKLNENRLAEINAFTKMYADHQSGISYLPVKAKTMDLSAIVDSGTAEVLEFTTLKPW